MGYYGKLEEKQKAQRLRKRGLSYNEILKYVAVSKDTLSRWCRDIVLTDKQKKLLQEKIYFGQHKGSLIAAENKKKQRQEKTRVIFENAATELGILSKRDAFIAGIALYAGEGYKSDNGNVGFANADPELIKFMSWWFREFCNVPTSKFRGAIWIHEGLDEQKAKKFWSKIASIPPKQFHKTYVVKNKPDSKKIRKNLHYHGIFSIRFSDTGVHRKIIGWTRALLPGTIPVEH